MASDLYTNYFSIHFQLDIRTLLFCCCLFISLIITIVLLLVYLSIIFNQNGTIDPIKSLINHSKSCCFQKYVTNSMRLYLQSLTFAFRQLQALLKTGHSRKMWGHNLNSSQPHKSQVPCANQSYLCTPHHFSVSGFKPHSICYSLLRGEMSSCTSRKNTGLLTTSMLPFFPNHLSFHVNSKMKLSLAVKCRGETQICTAPSARSPCLPPSHNFCL